MHTKIFRVPGDEEDISQQDSVCSTHNQKSCGINRQGTLRRLWGWSDRNRNSGMRERVEKDNTDENNSMK